MLDIPSGVCAQCGRLLGVDVETWLNTANLTPDAILIEHCAFDFGEVLTELDIAFDWCSVICLGRWMMRAAAHMGSPARPPAA